MVRKKNNCCLYNILLRKAILTRFRHVNNWALSTSRRNTNVKKSEICTPLQNSLYENEKINFIIVLLHFPTENVTETVVYFLSDIHENLSPRGVGTQLSDVNFFTQLLMKFCRLWTPDWPESSDHKICHSGKNWNNIPIVSFCQFYFK